MTTPANSADQLSEPLDDCEDEITRLKRRHRAEVERVTRELAEARAAGFAEAVAMLRDDDRYTNWWTALPFDDPAYSYWQGPARRHMADYLETVVQPLPGKPEAPAETGGRAFAERPTAAEGS